MKHKLRHIKKKGDVYVSTVLLVGFTISLIALVTVWGRNFITEKAEKEDKLAQARLKCTSLTFDVTYLAPGGDDLVARIKNTGPQNIDGFIYRVKGDNVYPLESMDIVRKAEARELLISLTNTDVSNPRTVEMIPKIRVGKGVYVPCTGQMKEARIGAA